MAAANLERITTAGASDGKCFGNAVRPRYGAKCEIMGQGPPPICRLPTASEGGRTKGFSQVRAMATNAVGALNSASVELLLTLRKSHRKLAPNLSGCCDHLENGGSWKRRQEPFTPNQRIRFLIPFLFNITRLIYWQCPTMRLLLLTLLKSICQYTWIRLFLHAMGYNAIQASLLRPVHRGFFPRSARMFEEYGEGRAAHSRCNRGSILRPVHCRMYRCG